MSGKCDWARCNDGATVRVTKKAGSFVGRHSPPRPAWTAERLLLCADHAEAFKASGGQHREYAPLEETPQ